MTDDQVNQIVQTALVIVITILYSYGHYIGASVLLGYALGMVFLSIKE